jgi:hypothetical protein
LSALTRLLAGLSDRALLLPLIESAYHKRSNIESTIGMIKAKFRDHVRSKTDVAMKNEVLCKILCHNICCLVSAMYELNITPTFTGLDDERTVSKLAA